MSVVKSTILFFFIFSFELNSQKPLNTTAPQCYVFRDWKGPPLDVIAYIPPNATNETSVLIVMPGKTRDTQLYHATWLQKARDKQFIVLTVGVRKNYFPDEFSYSAGRVVSTKGYAMHEEQWLFSAIELLFEDFKGKHKLKTNRFFIFGSGPGAGFVHRYLLFKPKAPVLKAISLNPNSVTIPNKDIQYPYGLKNAPIKKEDIKEWLTRRHLIVTTKEKSSLNSDSLTDSVLGELQGSSNFERGNLLFNAVKQEVVKRKMHLNWNLVNINDSTCLDHQIIRLASQFFFDH